MKTQQRFPHYVRRNEITKVPRRFITLDVEAREEKTPVGVEQYWRLAVAHFWSADRGHRERDYETTFDEPTLLWKEVDSFCRPKTRTILYAHNLAYDIRVGGALLALPHLCWTLVAHNL